MKNIEFIKSNRISLSLVRAGGSMLFKAFR